MSFISVPCVNCSASVGLEHERCPSCGAIPSPEIKAALEARFEAADADYRNAKERVLQTSGVLFVFGLLYFVFAGILFAYATPSAFGMVPTGETYSGLITHLCVRGSVAFVCVGLSMRHARPAFAIALVFELLTTILLYVTFPLTFFGGFMSVPGVTQWLARGIFWFRLFDGIRADNEIRAIRKRYMEYVKDGT